MDEPKQHTLASVLSSSLPQALALGLCAITALLVNMQVSFARMDANVQTLLKQMEELRTDTKSQMEDLEHRVRALEINHR
jgi:hypothetical protein